MAALEKQSVAGRRGVCQVERQLSPSGIAVGGEERIAELATVAMASPIFVVGLSGGEIEISELPPEMRGVAASPGVKALTFAMDDALGTWMQALSEQASAKVVRTSSVPLRMK